jgi:hypothetical protein
VILKNVDRKLLLGMEKIPVHLGVVSLRNAHANADDHGI